MAATFARPGAGEWSQHSSKVRDKCCGHSWPKTPAEPWATHGPNVDVRQLTAAAAEHSVVAGRVIHGPEFAVGTGRAVRRYLRWLVAVWVFGDEGEPAFAGVGDATAFLAAQHRRSIPGPPVLGQRPNGVTCVRHDGRGARPALRGEERPLPGSCD